MTFQKIIEDSVKKAKMMARERGLPICEVANKIMKKENGYKPIGNSIWQHVGDANEFVICLSTSDFMEGRQRDPQSWGWKVPRILLFHLGSEEFNREHGEISYGQATDSDFYLFKLRFTCNPR